MVIKRLLFLRLLHITNASLNSQKALAVRARNWMSSLYRVPQRGRIKGNIRENELTIKWGDDETEKGKTIYYFIKDNNKVVVEDFVMTNDKYFKFGNATYFTKDL